MLAEIATTVEGHREAGLRDGSAPARRPIPPTTEEETIAEVVQHAIETVPCAAVFAPTHSGTTARMISRFKPPARIVAISPNETVCQALAFSYGVTSIHAPEEPDDWQTFANDWLRDHRIAGRLAVLVTGPSPRNPDTNYRVEFLRVGSA